MYRFIVAAYTSCTAGDFYSGYREATCAPTSHGRQAFTSSGTFTVPSGVRSINIHCTGGGGGGTIGYYKNSNNANAGEGGGGGYTSYTNNIAVSPGLTIPITVGNGGAAGNSSAQYYTGGTSSAIVNNVTYQAYGGNQKSDGSLNMESGGSGGGSWAGISSGKMFYAGNGGSDGSNALDFGGVFGYGQGTTTKEFGTGTLYSGGGGGGGFRGYQSSSEQVMYGQYGSGGAGGGGNGAGSNVSGIDVYGAYYVSSSSGSAGTGGGGGGGGYWSNIIHDAQPGGSGNVIITW